jgi:hypothetical protein
MKMLGGKGDAKQKPAKDINDDLPNDDIPTEIPF